MGKLYLYKSVWCNGNIRDFQSQAEGSIPSTDFVG